MNETKKIITSITVIYDILFMVLLLALILLMILLPIQYFGWFLINLIGIISIIPLYFWSLEHERFEKKYGKEKGDKITLIFGLISSEFFFLFWIGIWISPQPKFLIMILQDYQFIVPIINFKIYLIHLIIALPFLILGAWIPLIAINKMSIEVAETHKPNEVITTGMYSYIRHPQYFGGLLAHIGISILIPALFSLIITPIVFLIIFFMTNKEEKELVKEFGEIYEKYKEQVPMLIPFIKRNRKNRSIL